ncbi:MAG TPA: DoxX family protein [Opitutaceae bacterium]|jgi:putative oxidoreductase|nr:DoxX family protein [Opitutaceae bacterium]
MNILSKIHGLLVQIGRILQCPVLLVIRLYWGWQFFLTGKGKLQHLDKVTNFFASLHIPAPHINAIMAASTEVTCGILLILGLFSRFASAALICVMCVAYYTAEHDALVGIFKDPDKFTGADPFLYLYAAVIVFCFGPGKIALDRFVFKDEPV